MRRVTESAMIKISILEDYGDWGTNDATKTIPDFFKDTLQVNGWSTIHILKDTNIPKIQLFKDEMTFKITSVNNKKSMDTLELIKKHSWEFIDKGLCAYIYGNTGTGKTSYCIEIVKFYIRDLLSDRICSATESYYPFFINVKSFNDYVNDRRHKVEHTDYLIKRMKDAALLVLDDMSFIEDGTTAFNRLYEVLDYRDLSGLSTLFTSNLTPTDFKDVFKGKDAFISRVLGRCREDHIIPLVGPDMRNKK